MKYFIVNECDRPCAEHVAVEVDGKLFYIHPKLRHWAGMDSSASVSMEAFGFDVEENTPSEGFVTFTRNRDSVACYPQSGSPRDWQDWKNGANVGDSFTLPMHGYGGRKLSELMALGPRGVYVSGDDADYRIRNGAPGEWRFCGADSGDVMLDADYTVADQEISMDERGNINLVVTPREGEAVAITCAFLTIIKPSVFDAK